MVSNTERHLGDIYQCDTDQNTHQRSSAHKSSYLH